MTRHWELRSELYNAFHRWPTLLAFIALGCAVGWVLSFIWPPYSRANTQIYVGLNPYRTYSDTQFLALTLPKYSNIDNYHYWQMSQLQAVIFLDAILESTLSELRKVDPYWDGINVDQIRQMLEAEWRSAGAWSLIATHPDSAQAEQAVDVWSAVIQEQISRAIQSGRDTFMIDQRLDAIAKEELRAKIQRLELLDAKTTLLAWDSSSKDFPTDQPLNAVERWHVLSQVTRLAQFTPEWLAVLENQPSVSSPPGDYQDWISQVKSLIDAELISTQKRLEFLESERIQLTRLFSEMSKKSLGLSPNIEIEGIERLLTKVVRPTSLFILIGGTIGLLIWALTQLVMITNKD